MKTKNGGYICLDEIIIDTYRGEYLRKQMKKKGYNIYPYPGQEQDGPKKIIGDPDNIKSLLDLLDSMEKTKK